MFWPNIWIWVLRYQKFPVVAYATRIAYGQDEDDFGFLGICYGMLFDQITQDMNGFSQNKWYLHQITHVMPLFGKISFFIKLSDCASIFMQMKENGENIKHGFFS